MALEINQNVSVDIPQLQNFSSAIESFGAQLQQLGEMFGSRVGDTTSSASPRDTLAGMSGRPEGDTSKTDSLAMRIQQLTEALQRNTEKLGRGGRDFAAELKHQENLNKLDDVQRAKKRQEAAEDREKNRAQARNDRNFNWARSIAYGAGMLGVGAAGNFGKIAGSEAQSINAGALNYTDFMTNYYNRKADAQQSLISGGLMAAAGVATAINPFIGLPLMGIAGLANYTTGQTTEIDKAGTQFGRSQELGDWRLRMAGLQGAGTGMGLNTGFGSTPIGSGQFLSLSPKYAPYASTYSDVTLGGKRDVMGRMNETDLNEYNRALNLTAMAIGTNDIGGLNKSVTTLSGMTGETPMNTLNKILDSNEKYGGDTAANTAKLVQILQTTPLSPGAASDLVNRYQFNQPMLNNQLALATASPLDTFNQMVRMQASGVASQEELRTGEWSAKHKQRIAQNSKDMRTKGISAFDPIAQMMYMATVPGQNVYANHLADVTGSKNGAFNPATENSTVKAFGDFVQKSLANIMVTNQTVKADTVVVSGIQVKGSTSEFIRQIPDKKPIKPINTGTGQHGGGHDAIESQLTVVPHRQHGN